MEPINPFMSIALITFFTWLVKFKLDYVIINHPLLSQRFEWVFSISLLLSAGIIGVGFLSLLMSVAEFFSSLAE